MRCHVMMMMITITIAFKVVMMAILMKMILMIILKMRPQVTGLQRDVMAFFLGGFGQTHPNISLR